MIFYHIKSEFLDIITSPNTDSKTVFWMKRTIKGHLRLFVIWVDVITNV